MRSHLLLVLAAIIFMTGCSAESQISPIPTATIIPKPTSTATTNPMPTGYYLQSSDTHSYSHTDSSPGTVVGVRYAGLKIKSGSIARYVVREQLARLSTPSYAIGETQNVQGIIPFDDTGTIQADSKILINMQSLVSDEQRRDRYLRSNSLQSNQFPTAEFLVTKTSGLDWPLPTSGNDDFQLRGTLKIRGSSKPVP